MLTSLDYFAFVYDKHDIYSFFPLPLFLGYVTVGLTYHMLSLRFKYLDLIVCGNIVTCICLAILLLASIIFKGENQDTGFAISMAVCYVMGVGSNLSQLTFFAMINYLSHDVVSKFTVGTAVSGLLMTGLRIIIVAIGGSNNSHIVPIIIYFAIAIAFIIFDIFLNVLFFQS